MDMIFFLDSSFREVQYWSEDHLVWMSRTCILNLFSTHVKIVKVGQNCNVGSQAPKDVSHTHSHGYEKERHDAHFIIHSSHTSLSHLIGSYNLRGFSLLHACEKKQLRFRKWLGKYGEQWPLLILGYVWHWRKAKFVSVWLNLIGDWRTGLTSKVFAG